MVEPANQMKNTNTGPAWYVVHLRYRHEAKVQSGLESQGLEVFLPIVTVRSRRRDRVQLLEEPLFPGYLFVRTDLNPQAYHGIIRHQGVVRILGNKGCCTPVVPETVTSIQAVLESGRFFDAWPRLVIGRQVRVVSGPLCGAIGTILRHKPGKRRLVVGVDLLGRAIAVDLEEESVEPFS